MKRIITILIFAQFILSCGQGEDVTKVNNFKPELVLINNSDTCYSYFNLTTLEINNISIFQLSKEEIIDTLRLSKGNIEIGQNEQFYYIGNGKSFIEFDDLLNRVLTIEVVDSTMSFSNLKLQVGLLEEEIEKRYPILYKKRSLSPTFDRNTNIFKNTLEVTLHDCNMNRVRVFLLENRVNSISYWADDDPALYEQFD